jgi:hypothetical protein
MKIISVILLIASLQSLLIGQTKEQEFDQIIKLDGKIKVSSESERWLKVTVPFVIVDHPDLGKMQGKRPDTIEEMFNPEFLNDLKINIWVSFMNEFKRKELRGERQDVLYLDYYSAEIECLCLEINRKTKKAEFLIPTVVAKMNGWGNYPEFTGYVVEFSRNGEVFKVRDQIKFFNYDNAEYLEKFRVEALNKSSNNEGILIPGHLISDAYLTDLGPILRN